MQGAWSSCFNPRPRTGGDYHRTTRLAGRGCFNPRPRTGGDPLHDPKRMYQLCFNPRPRTGGDIDLGLSSCTAVVSIHAPARGATRNWHREQKYIMFQSTPPHGGRRLRCCRCGSRYLFQSTPPHGGRNVRCTLHMNQNHSFNPRPRTGGDCLLVRITGRQDFVSIHAPARGAT